MERLGAVLTPGPRAPSSGQRAAQHQTILPTEPSALWKPVGRFNTRASVTSPAASERRWRHAQAKKLLLFLFETLPRLNICSDGDPQDKSCLFWQPGYAENFTPESSFLCLTGSSAQEIKSAEWLHFERSCQVEWKRCDKILTLDLLVSFGLFYLHRSIFSRAPSGGWLQDSSQAPPTLC